MQHINSGVLIALVIIAVVFVGSLVRGKAKATKAPLTGGGSSGAQPPEGPQKLD